MGTPDLFEHAYTAAVSEELPPDPVAQERPGRELRLRRAPSAAIALGGCVVTPDRAIDPGYVVIEDGVVRAVEPVAPEAVEVIDTGGVIVPGLIDLHGHPEFNVFAAWEPPQSYVNRYAWRGSELYAKLVRGPQNLLLEKLSPWTQLRYAEIRALVGGVTAIQGAGQQASRYQDEALVRNVDKWIFGGQVGRAMIDLPSGTRGADSLTSILRGISAGTVKAFYLHLAEGKPSNSRSATEFDTLVELGGLTPATVIIHGTALSETQLGDAHDAGAKLVWSPQSNLRLYGETTRAAHAVRLGMPVGLGADWLPSGSSSLLAEMKVARRSLATQTGHDPGARKLVDMVTRDAARIAGLEDMLGTIAAGRPADLAVFERHHDDPWENVATADPSHVQLVLIGGDIAYGHHDLVHRLVGHDAADDFESLLAWGKPMLLDTGYQARPGEAAPPRLSALRTELISAYPQVGPIFA
ncbi:amidohydrolase family protein [Amycolatopsis sp. BJA-103]|uniref:amidohydrolase family protein n=1 Tax=Amycolatopsis sp. BJA-103 TaxID=1911175 RepID=UPI000C755FF0|nr:amidohydrolase family protein [Amycolatopsis sp. BJA-103]AUI60207.1 amidohydrolase [Amycolatopsis sp. BJA-103]PNE13583.1 amidohydrolase [Amycolatopsis sp. BJA-103]